MSWNMGVVQKRNGSPRKWNLGVGQNQPTGASVSPFPAYIKTKARKFHYKRR